MRVIVIGMEMPGTCIDCDLYDEHYRHGMCKGHGVLFGPEDDWKYETRPNWCPLRPLPEKHGRLIDVDAFKTMCQEAVRDIRDEVFLPQDIEKVRVLSEVTENLCLDLDEAPTIIEAED